MPCFARRADRRGYPPDLRLRLRSGDAAEAAGSRSLELFTIVRARSASAGQEVVPVPIFHGRRPILGFRFGAVRVSDRLQPHSRTIVAAADGLDVLVLDALREEPHPTHFSVAEAIEAARRIGARQHLLHAHVPRPRRTQPPAPACLKAWSWPMMAWCDWSSTCGHLL